MYGENQTTTVGTIGPGNTLRMPNPENKVGEIERECSEFASASKRLQEVVSTLENALTPVLRMRAEQSCETSPPEPVRVPLAHIIHERVVEVDAVANRLQMILSMLEL